MDLIPSFSVDHTKIIPGIFVSRVDETDSGDLVTTYDIRIKRPNIEPAIDVAAMHSLEHIVATFLRNNDNWKHDVIYFGPMGCLTGFYLILKDNKEPSAISDLIINAFRSVESVDVVPGATAINCGNYKLHNLDAAKQCAKEFAKYLEDNKEHSCIYSYPKTERFVTTYGQRFFDS